MSNNAKCGNCGWQGDSSTASYPGPYYKCPRCKSGNIHLRPDEDDEITSTLRLVAGVLHHYRELHGDKELEGTTHEIAEHRVEQLLKRLS